jgi:hypothetical protein
MCSDYYAGFPNFLSDWSVAPSLTFWDFDAIWLHFDSIMFIVTVGKRYAATTTATRSVQFNQSDWLIAI